MTEPVSLTIAAASSGKAVSIGTMLTNSYRHLICGWYVSSLATDRSGLTVGRPMVCGFYYMVGLCLCDTLSVSEDDVASRVQGVVPIQIVFGTNSCS